MKTGSATSNCLDGKVLLVTHADAPAAGVVQRYNSLADIERGFRVLKSDMEIGPVYHRLLRRIRAQALVCFMALILYRVMRMRMRMRLKANNRTSGRRGCCSNCSECLYPRPPNSPGPVCGLRFGPSAQAHQSLTHAKCGIRGQSPRCWMRLRTGRNSASTALA